MHSCNNICRLGYVIFISSQNTYELKKSFTDYNLGCLIKNQMISISHIQFWYWSTSIICLVFSKKDFEDKVLDITLLPGYILTTEVLASHQKPFDSSYTLSVTEYVKYGRRVLYQGRLRREWRPSLSVISAAFIAFGKSCLLANTKRTASLSSSWK